MIFPENPRKTPRVLLFMGLSCNKQIVFHHKMVFYDALMYVPQKILRLDSFGVSFLVFIPNGPTVWMDNKEFPLFIHWYITKHLYKEVLIFLHPKLRSERHAYSTIQISNRDSKYLQNSKGRKNATNAKENFKNQKINQNLICKGLLDHHHLVVMWKII